jgi:hypothetical protein
MRSLLLIVCAFAILAPTSVAAPGSAPDSQRSAALLDRALGLTADERELPPTGQCIVSCEDRMFALKRCPDGECPAFDCRSGVASCSGR